MKRGFFSDYLNDFLCFTDENISEDWRRYFEKNGKKDSTGIIWIEFEDENKFWKADEEYDNYLFSQKNSKKMILQ